MNYIRLYAFFITLIKLLIFTAYESSAENILITDSTLKECDWEVLEGRRINRVILKNGIILEFEKSHGIYDPMKMKITGIVSKKINKIYNTEENISESAKLKPEEIAAVEVVIRSSFIDDIKPKSGNNTILLKVKQLKINNYVELQSRIITQVKLKTNELVYFNKQGATYDPASMMISGETARRYDPRDDVDYECEAKIEVHIEDVNYVEIMREKINPMGTITFFDSLKFLFCCFGGMFK